MNAPTLPTSANLADALLWYKDAVIYQLHVKSYFDANGDGIGDFPGLISKLDYIASLGINTIWLLPFYPSPRRDDGYDISDYRGVHPDYGCMRDVRRFVKAAHKRGLRVITELVVNHTSDQHPWFQRARRAKPGSSLRDFYVWSDTDTKYAGTRIIFIDSERSNWTWDEVANAYYWHRFYSHQPDLNFKNPRVMDAVLSVMRFWLDMGVDGLRLDAVPYLVEREGTINENLPETHEVLKKFRAVMDAEYPGRVFLAEANQWPEDVKEYFGAGDECHMAFHFPLMPRMYMALAREDRFPITDILRQTPEIPPNCQWAIFLRNHDELTLEMVTDAERDYLWKSYATDRRARINLGIRRRLAPLLERDRRRIELMTSLLISMPGTPVIYYGDELGMGDNIFLGDRDGVRTPMQWSPDRNGGFSHAEPGALVLPPIMDSLYGYGAVNVESQHRDPHSLLNWTRRMLAVRQQYTVFGRGSLSFLYPKNRKVLAFVREHEGASVLCVANVSRTPQAVELNLAQFEGRVPVELSGDSLFPPIGQLPYLLTLAPYGFYWFLLARDSEWPAWHMPAPEPLPDYQTLVMRNGPREMLSGVNRERFEKDILPPYLEKRRWFSSKDRVIRNVAIRSAICLASFTGEEFLLTEVEVETDRDRTSWFMPLTVAWDDQIAPPLVSQLAIARVRKGARTGLLTDAFAFPDFARYLALNVRNGSRITEQNCAIEFRSGHGPVASMDVDAKEIDWIAAEQSNSSLILGDTAVIKIFRKLAEGVHPEAEMTRYLTSNGFDHAPQLLGEVVRTNESGSQATLAVAQTFIRNQGDGWSWSLDLMSRAAGDRDANHTQAITHQEYLDIYQNFAANVGRRLAKMHYVLAKETDEEAFRPRAATTEDVVRWTERIQEQLKAAWSAIDGVKDHPAQTGALVKKLSKLRSRLLAIIRPLAEAGAGELLTRVHGDFHLGQVLVSSSDVFIIDFEGQPGQTLDSRRDKASPLQDVAGFLRSLSYAAAASARKIANAGTAQPADDPNEFTERFAAVAREAFLAAYSDKGDSLAPARADLLRLFLLEKAAYEVAYEAANRPTWIDIPLAGLADVADQIIRGSA